MWPVVRRYGLRVLFGYRMHSSIISVTREYTFVLRKRRVRIGPSSGEHFLNKIGRIRSIPEDLIITRFRSVLRTSLTLTMMSGILWRSAAIDCMSWSTGASKVEFSANCLFRKCREAEKKELVFIPTGPDNEFLRQSFTQWTILNAASELIEHYGVDTDSNFCIYDVVAK